MRSLGVGFGVTEVKLGQNLFLYNYPDVDNPYEPRDGEHVQFPAGVDDMKPASVIPHWYAMPCPESSITP